MTADPPARKRSDRHENRDHRVNTVAMLGRAYSLLGFQIVNGVVGAGYPQKPKHSAVFGQLGPEGARLTDLARGANMTPQAMGELVDELEELGYVTREPDPVDRRAKLIRLTPLGQACVTAAITTIDGIEDKIDDVLGADGHDRLRALLAQLLENPPHEPVGDTAKLSEKPRPKRSRPGRG